MAVRIELGHRTSDGLSLETPFTEIARNLAQHGDEADVVVDLCELETIRSDELNGLIALNCQLRGEGRSLVLANVHEQLLQIFRLTRLDRLFKIDNADGAVVQA